MALSRVQYTGNGTGIYTVPFAYLSQAYVQVYVAGVLKTLGVDYTFLSASSMQFTVDPTGLLIDIRRVTPDGVRLVDFQDGAILNEAGLDLSADQAFHVVQETKDDMDAKMGEVTDGTFDAESKRIKNVLDPVAAQDAATKTWVEVRTAADVAAAAASATYAAGSASTAGTHAANALSSATAADTSAAAAASEAAAAAASEAAAASAAASLNTATLMTKAANLSDVADVPTARGSLGLGTAAVKDTGTLTGSVPLVGTESATAAVAGLVRKSSATENAAGSGTGVVAAVDLPAAVAALAPQLPPATASISGYMTATYAAKLDGIQAGAIAGFPKDAGPHGVGMVAFCTITAINQTIPSGGSIAGPSLKYIGIGTAAGVAVLSAAPQGTWKNISGNQYFTDGGGAGDPNGGPFQRIA